MIKTAQPNAEVDDVEHDDEFDSYMEASLMQEADSLGIFDQAKQAAEANVYKEALQRIEAEVAKVPQHPVEEERKGPAAEKAEGEDEQ